MGAMSRGITHDCAELIESIGMSVDDGVAFTVCGGQLTDGGAASSDVQRMNGWSVEEAAREIIRMTGDFPR